MMQESDPPWPAGIAPRFAPRELVAKLLRHGESTGEVLLIVADALDEMSAEMLCAGRVAASADIHGLAHELRMQAAVRQARSGWPA